MQINFVSNTTAGRALALPAWRRWARPAGPIRRCPVNRPASELFRAATEALRGHAWENPAWLALAGCGLGLILLSFWR